MLKTLGKRWREKFEFGIFTLPVLICIAVAFYIPFAMTIRYSMTKWNGISKHPKFVGLDNFKQIFSGIRTSPMRPGSRLNMQSFTL